MLPIDPTASGSGTSPEDPHLDPERFQSIVALFEDMPGGFQECIVVPFLNLLELQLPLLEEALAARDAEGLRRTAHTLKGGGRDLGFLRFGHLAERMEREGRAGRMPDREVPLAFQQELDWVRGYLADR